MRPMSMILRLALIFAFLLPATNLLTGCGAKDPGEELWVIGVDGADWDQIDPMIARGEMPNFARLKNEGTSGILLSDKPMISPILWTSISTGKTPDLHGVTWFMTDAPDGSKIPISSEERRVRTFWNIASEAGMSCGITGWWATWPAEPINGYLISDAVAWHSFGINGRSNPAEGKTWPWDLVHRVDELMPDPAAIPDDLMTRMIHLPAERLIAPTSGTVYDNPISHLRQALATTRGYTDLTLAMMETERPRVMSIYYEGTDAITHLFSKFEVPRQPWISQADFDAYQDLLTEYWKWQDEILGELLARRGPNTTVIVLSDHGFRKGAERRKEDKFRVETADEDHMPDGLIILHGPNIKAGGRIEGADIYDVTPTILYILGLAAGRDMVGHPLTDAFTTESLRARPVEWVATYETSERRRGSAAAQDQQTGQDLKKMLRSLGYVAGVEGGDGSTDDGYTFEQIVNLATVYMGQGRADEAVEKLEEVLKEHPGNFEIRINLSQALYLNDQFDESEETFSALIRDFPDRLEVYEDFAMALRFSGKFEQALEVYDRGLAVAGEWVPGLAGKGLCLSMLGSPEEGMAKLEQACRIDPSSHTAFLNLGQIQQHQGDLAGAAKSLARALELEPTESSTAISLAEVRSEQGDPRGAVQLLQQVLAKGGDKALLLSKLGSLQLRTGEGEKALETLLEASKLDRNNPDLLGDLGIAYAMTGSLPAAVSAFEKLVEVAPDMADAHAQLGVLLAQNGQMAPAVNSLRKAVDLAGDNPNFRMNLAYALQQTGDAEGAAAQFSKVIELDPNIAHAYYGLGLIEMSRGNTAEGQRLVSKARQMEPSLPAPSK